MAEKQSAAATENPRTEVNSVPDLAALLANRTEQALAAKAEADAKEQAEPEAEETANEQEPETPEAVQDNENDEVPDDPPAPDDEGEAEQNDEGEGNPDASGTPGWVKARLAKMAAQKKELKAQLDKLNAEVSSLKESKSRSNVEDAPLPQIEGDRLSFIKNATELAEWHKNATNAINAIDEFLDNDGQAISSHQQQVLQALAKTHDLTNADGELSLPKLRKTRRIYGDILAKEVPNKFAWFEAEPRHSAAAEARFPWWKDRDSEEYRIASNAVKLLPELRRHPEWKTLVGLWVKGIIADRKEQEAQAAKGKPGKTVASNKAKVTKVGAGTLNAAPADKPKVNKADVALKEFGKQPFTVGGLAQLLSARASK